jgi:hypothetical protein
MNRPSSFDDRLAAWLDEGPATGPSEVLVSAHARVRSTRQRPTWWLQIRGKTMETTLRAPSALSTRAMFILLAVMVTIALVAAAAFVGSRLSSEIQRGLNAAPFPIARGADALLAYSSFTSDQQAGDIYVVRADGTDSRRLTSDPQFDASPVWSPDGSRLAFNSWGGKGLQLRVADPDGSIRVLADMPTDFHSTAEPAWSPDGNFLLFDVDPHPNNGLDEGTESDVYVVSVNGGDAHRLLASDQTLTTSSANWSGNRIVMRGVEDGQAQLLVATVSNPSAPWDLTATRIDTALVSDLVAFGGSAWSPDGTEVATTFINAGTGFGTAMVIPGGGGAAAALLRDPTKDQIQPAWSPDGTWLTVLEITKQLADHGLYHLVKVDSDGSNARTIPSVDLNGNGGPAFISPDGSFAAARKALTDSATPDAIEILDLVGTAPAIEIPAREWSQLSWQPVANPVNPAANAPAGAPQF